jgi:putative ABC transport system ATP-binding protein
MSFLELKRISKSYKTGKTRVPVLRDVSLKVNAGEFVAIMGPSGSGKSTLLYLLGLLDKADRGEYRLSGREVGRLGDSERAHLRNETFGFVFQTFNLLPRTRVSDNVMLPLLYARKRVDGKKRAWELIGQVGLASRAHHHSNELSGGEQQRVAVARALMMEPQVIIADEPTGNLDQKTGRAILNLFRDLNKKGQTVILVTHDPRVAAYSDRIIKIEDGRIVR